MTLETYQILRRVLMRTIGYADDAAAAIDEMMYAAMDADSLTDDEAQAIIRYQHAVLDLADAAADLADCHMTADHKIGRA